MPVRMDSCPVECSLTGLGYLTVAYVNRRQLTGRRIVGDAGKPPSMLSSARAGTPYIDDLTGALLSSVIVGVAKSRMHVVLFYGIPAEDATMIAERVNLFLRDQRRWTTPSSTPYQLSE